MASICDHKSNMSNSFLVIICTQNECGSGGATIRLAREGGVSVHTSVDCYTAIAGKSNRRTAAPTVGTKSGLERTLLVPFGKLGPIIGVLPGLRFFFLVLPGLLALRSIPAFLFVSHCHLPSVRIGLTCSIEQRMDFRPPFRLIANKHQSIQICHLSFLNVSATILGLRRNKHFKKNAGDTKP